jgi:hypothetical protein
MLVLLVSWYLIGLIIACVLTYDDIRKNISYTFTIGDIIINLVLSCLGPILMIIAIERFDFWNIKIWERKK